MNATESYAVFQNDPAYIELQEMLNISSGVTLGGNETYEELLEMCEDMFGDIV